MLMQNVSHMSATISEVAYYFVSNSFNTNLQFNRIEWVGKRASHFI